MYKKKHNYTLEEIPANRRLVEELYANDKITNEAKDYALKILYPHDQWGLWIFRILLATGVTLILSGIVYFFAFNWTKLTPLIKLSSIEFSIIICLIGAYFYSLEKIIGKVLLLSASVMVGVLMAVFGQIYQTGADAYQLFMIWSIFIFGWTLISNFFVQWILWLVISNLFLILWGQQGALPSREMEYMIYTYMMIFNGSALILREYLVTQKNYQWLEAKWIRFLLVFAILAVMIIPIISWILFFDTQSVVFGSILGFIGHGLIFLFYRYKLVDMWVIAFTIVSICIILEIGVIKIIFGTSGDLLGQIMLLSLATFSIFTSATFILRAIAKATGRHV